MKFIIGFMLLMGTMSLSIGGIDKNESSKDTQEAKIDTFTFSSNGTDINGKIYLPSSFNKVNNLPAIYLIDFTEQHWRVAKDEFEKVITAAEEILDSNVVIVTLEEHLNVDANYGAFQKYYDIFKDMSSYVDDNYTNNSSRTFIGRGSEAGIVLMTLFLEDTETSLFENFIATDSPGSFNNYIINTINNDDFPKNKLNKKLHFSFSTSNNRYTCNKMITAIKDAQYPWLQFDSIEYTDSDYENTYPTAFAAGLEYVFKNFTTGLEQNLPTVFREFQLKQNYPNPFNPTTKISYSLPEQNYVSLKVFDVLGREVSELINKDQQVGNYEVEFNATNLTSGVYFYKIQAGDFVETKKMVLMK